MGKRLMDFTRACCGINIVVVVLVILLVGEGWAQQQDTLSLSPSSWCVNQLVPCLNYLNGTHDPPDSCCDPLKSVIKSNPECLCSMISIKGTKEAEQAGINVTEAQELPARCGQHVNPVSCLTTTAGSPNSKNSIPNSARFSISLSQIMTVAATLSMIFQAAWALNTH